MSLSLDRSTASRLSREIGDLRSKEAAEAKKAADAQKKMNAAQDSARRATSSGSASMHLSTADRESRNLQSALDAQSKFASQAASKYQDLARLQDRIASQEESERKKAATDQEKARRDDEARRKTDAERQRRADAAAASESKALRQRLDDLESLLKQRLEDGASNTPSFSLAMSPGETEAYDVFISHATEDKEDFVQGLAESARSAGLRVWYDQFSIEWGESLRQQIDKGLAQSYFGVAVLSPSFFSKPWPQYELDALVGKGMSGSGRLLPIWHKVSKDEVAKHSPTLAERLALSTAFMSTKQIVEELVRLRDRYKERLKAEVAVEPGDVV